MKTLNDILKTFPLTEEENNIINLKTELVGKLVELKKSNKITQEQYEELCRFEKSNEPITLEEFIKTAHATGYEVILHKKSI